MEIKSMNYHMRKVTGCLMFEEMRTMTQSEACLNSTPLCPLTNNPDETQVLIPVHSFTCEPQTSLPEPDFLPAPVNRLHQLHQLWKCLSSNYLTQMQEQVTWTSKMSNLQPGAVVIL